MHQPSNLRHRLGTTLALYVVLAAALQGQSPGPSGTWRIADAPVELRPAISRADVVIVALTTETDHEGLQHPARSVDL